MAIARVNTVGDFLVASGTSIASPSFTATAGNLLVVAVRTTQDTASVTDTAGNKYGLVAARGPSTTQFSLWAAWNCLGHATNIVTATFEASGSNRGIAVAQYSGIATMPLDVVVTATGAASPITSPTFSTQVADTLIVSFAQVDATSSTWTPAGGATKFVGSVTSEVIMGMERIVSTLQSGTTASTACSSTSGLMLLTAAFAAPTSGGGTTVRSGVASAINVGTGVSLY